MINPCLTCPMLQQVQQSPHKHKVDNKSLAEWHDDEGTFMACSVLAHSSQGPTGSCVKKMEKAGFRLAFMTLKSWCCWRKVFLRTTVCSHLDWLWNTWLSFLENEGWWAGISGARCWYLQYLLWRYWLVTLGQEGHYMPLHLSPWFTVLSLPLHVLMTWA